jgi:hypothetical protein
MAKLACPQVDHGHTRSLAAAGAGVPGEVRGKGAKPPRTLAISASQTWKLFRYPWRFRSERLS